MTDAGRISITARTLDLARALLDARAERDRLRADAQAAVALMVERAAEVCDDLAIGYAKHKGAPGALHNAARDIRALAPVDGLAAVEALRVEMDSYRAAAAPATLAQTPTDPGDGWTWNERLGWIGPDGKPADPRRRG